MVKMHQLGALFLITLLVFTQAQSQEEDQVFVQDIAEYNHRYYSGYFEVSANQRIHYVYFESQRNPISDPIILNVGGGPGCSSLISLFYEHGPFIFEQGTKHLVLNKYAWNKRANLLFLELPGGVGYSETDNTSREIDDTITSIQAIAALNSFFHRFPGTIKNDLYLTGHAYGAAMQTYLAKLILDHNEDPIQKRQGLINLKGLLFGNPCTLQDQCYVTQPDSPVKSRYHYEFLYKRAFYTRQKYEDFLGACSLDYYSMPCFMIRQQMSKLFADTNSSGINIYSKCYKNMDIGTPENVDMTGIPTVFNPNCEDVAGAVDHMNDVNRTKWAWHLNQSVTWSVCNKDVYSKYLPGKNYYTFYPRFIQKGLKIWIVSGDLDSQVPIVGTKRWLRLLRFESQLSIVKVWRQWWVPGVHKGQDQVGGYIWQLKGLNFVTVKGAGLRTALDQPIAMQEVLNGFLDGKTLPYKNV